jgi:hypothetical protein
MSTLRILKGENRILKSVLGLGGKVREVTDDEGNFIVKVTLPGKRITLSKGDWFSACETASDNDISYVASRIVQVATRKLR